MGYRYQPESESCDELAVMLKASMPNAEFKFALDPDGLLRMAAWHEGRYYEKLLRENDLPINVVNEFRVKLRYTSLILPGK
jgi:hypothetical protein